jgi:hypothetical protein
MCARGGRGQPERESCGGWRVPDTPGKCAWFWKSKGFTVLTTLIVFEVGHGGVQRQRGRLRGDRRMQPPSGGRRDLVLALAAPANSIQSLT